jgi:REP element-mobilizing transposase RayT
MHPNPAGTMVQTIWEELPFHYPNLELDAFVLMPNHSHGIIVLKSLQTEPIMKLGELIHRFKSFTTAKYRHGSPLADYGNGTIMNTLSANANPAIAYDST